MSRMLLLALAAATTTPAVAQSAADEASRIRATLPMPAGTEFPGCAVGVFRDGHVTNTVFSGAAEVAGARPINANTQFYAASVSKQFTAVAALQLVQQGKLRLDDDVRKHLPELPQYQAPITVQMLLNHTSGVRDFLSLLWLSGHQDVSVVSRADALRLTLGQTQLRFTPGTTFDYSNGGYLLLSEIVERVSKRPFHEYVNRQILAPLGMTRSFILAGSRTADPNFARGYTVDDGKAKLSDNYPLMGGSGGLITTLNDLAKWDRDIDQGHKVWTPRMLRLMTEVGKFSDGLPVLLPDGSGYAQGVFVGQNWFFHSGGASGFTTYYARNQGKRVGVAMLCNRGGINAGGHAGKIVAALDGGLPPISEPAMVRTVAIDGRYRTEGIDAVYELQREGAEELTVTILAPDGSKRTSLPLKRARSGAFEGEGLKLVPDRDGQGFTLEAGRLELKFVREPVAAAQG